MAKKTVTLAHDTLRDKQGKPRRYTTSPQHAALLEQSGWKPVADPKSTTTKEK
jgi:hypothetical protein